MPEAYESFSLTYCEWCGTIHGGSEALVGRLDEPVARVGVLEELGGVENEQVHETTATEEGDCDCGGQIVKRWYAVGEVPEVDYDVDEDQISGRDPTEDSLINLSPMQEGWQEVSEIPSIEDGDNDA